MKTTDLVDNQYRRSDLPAFGPGDEVKVHVRVVESGKERIQVFQGNITATESIEVCDNAQLFGDVRTNKFIVAEAALFRGRSDPIEGKADSPEFSPAFRRLTKSK